MKNLHNALSSLITRRFLSFLFTLLFILYLPSYSAGQTIYELAVRMDSLYDKAKEGDLTAAEPFFDALRKVNKLAPNYPVDELYITGFKDEVNFVKKLNNKSKDLEEEKIFDMKKRKDSLINQVYSVLELSDSFKENIKKSVLSRGGVGSDVVKELLEFKLGTRYYPVSIEKKRTDLLIEISIVDGKIDEMMALKSAEISLVQQGDVLDLLPLGIENTAPIAPPIIIQNQGGGSAQSAIIDGTAKWLAERMRQELSIAFFDRFETWAEKDNIRLLFPNTFSVLKSSATTDYTLMMEIYKRAFEKDLNQLTFNIAPFLVNEISNGKKNQQLEQEIQLLNNQLVTLSRGSGMRIFETLDGETSGYSFEQEGDTHQGIHQRIMFLVEKYKDQYDYTLILYPKSFYYTDYVPTTLDTIRHRTQKLKELFENRKVVKQKELIKYQAIKYLSLSLNAVNMLKEGQHPSVLINSLYVEAPQLFPENNRLESVLLLLNVLSQSLTATNVEQNTVWIGTEALTRLSKDRQLQKIYFGLIRDRVHFLMRTKLEAQEYYWNDDLSKSNKDSIQVMEIREKALFNQYWGHFYESYDPVFENRYESDSTAYESFINNKIDSFDYNGFANFSQEKKREKLIRLSSLLCTTTPTKIGFFNELTEQDVKRRNAIVNLLSEPRNDEENKIFKLLGLSKKKVPSNLFFFDYPFSGNFKKLLWENGLNLEATKSAYFEENGDLTKVQQLLKPGLDAVSTLALIDSITNLRMEGQAKYEYYSLEVENSQEKSWDRFKSYTVGQIKNAIKTELVKKKEEDYLRADIRKLQLEVQSSFLNQFMDDKDKIGQLFSQFVQYTNKIDQINAQFKELRSNGQTNFGNQEFIYLIKNSMGILDLIFDFVIEKDDPNVVKNMETIQFATNNLLDAYIAGLDEDYNEVVMNIIPVVEKLVANKYDKLILPLEAEARDALSDEQSSMGLLPRSVALDSLRLLRDDKLRKMQEVFKYCTFIAAVAKSNSSDDVKKAINAIALPVGSYSIKRRTYANISLNAYPGITGGFELVQNNNFSEWAPNFGFTAPIGIGINWGYRTKINEKRYRKSLSYRTRVQKAEVGVDDRIFNGHSGSFFFSFVDLGALVLFRLNDSNEPLPEDVGIKQIFSPGVAYVHGLPRVPISIMAGAQLTPDLRKVGEGENVESANSFRFNLSIVVDLPIANFHTRRRPKR